MLRGKNEGPGLVWRGIKILGFAALRGLIKRGVVGVGGAIWVRELESD